MEETTLSAHAAEMMEERKISEEWLWKALDESDDIWEGKDGNMHYSKAVPEKGNRVLHVVVNANVVPQRVVTLFFDRRLRKDNEGKTR